MPNYVYNTLTIIGKKDRITAFVNKARGVRKQTGDQLGSINYSTPIEESSFEFNCLVPLPEEYSSVPYSPNGYEMEFQTWGVKWGAFDVEGPIVTNSSATYTFTCAWNSPEIFCCRLSEQWPDLLFVVSYGGEGPTLGRFTLFNGEYIDSIDEAANESPRYPEGDDISENEEEKWSEAFNAWEQQYRDVHKSYVVSMIEQHARTEELAVPNLEDL